MQCFRHRRRCCLRHGSAAVTVLAVVTACLVSAHPAWPHAGNTDPNTIHACVAPKDGNTRIVGVNGACKNGETASHWGITGPAGLQGQTGPTGPEGPPGPAGPAVY